MKRRYIALTATAALLAVGSVATMSHGTPLRVIDGDTLRQGDERLRIENLDAPDVGSHAKCDLEERRGQAAKAFAIRLVTDGRALDVRWAGRRDRYHRKLVRVMIDGEDFAALMIRGGHGRPWRGRSSNWCIF